MVKSTYSAAKFSSIAQSCLTLWPHGLQHTRPPCPSPTPGACSNSCPLSRWCHPIISPSVVPFSFCLHLSSIRDFSNESLLCIRWPNYWSFSFSISLSNDVWLLSHVQFFATPWTIAPCSLPVSSVHEIVQASILERVNIPFSRGFLNLGLLHCRKILYLLSHQDLLISSTRTHFSSITKSVLLSIFFYCCWDMIHILLNSCFWSIQFSIFLVYSQNCATVITNFRIFHHCSSKGNPISVGIYHLILPSRIWQPLLQFSLYMDLSILDIS